MKFNIKKIRREKGLTQAALVSAANISQPYLSQLENGSGGRAPSMETLVALAEVLDVRPSDLINDAKPIAVAGKVGAGARVPLIDAYEKGDGLYHVAGPSELSGGRSIVGVEVEGDSMLPVYRNGDVLFYSRDVMGVPSEAIGAICICEDSGGDVWVKYVRNGADPGSFHLISLNPLTENMFDVELKWAAPVRLHWPLALVERVD